LRTKAHRRIRAAMV